MEFPGFPDFGLCKGRADSQLLSHFNFSGGRTVPTKRWFKEKAPFYLFIFMGSFARTLFSRTLLPWPILCYSVQILHAQRFSNTSFGRTLLASNLGASCRNRLFGLGPSRTASTSPDLGPVLGAKCSKSRDLTAIAICDSNRESQITSDSRQREPYQKSSLFWLVV